MLFMYIDCLIDEFNWGSVHVAALQFGINVMCLINVIGLLFDSGSPAWFINLATQGTFYRYRFPNPRLRNSDSV